MFATVVGVVLLVAGGVGIAAHYSLFAGTAWTLIASFTPLFLPVAAGALVLLALGRRRHLAALAVAVLAVGVWTQVPLYRAASGAPVADGPPVRVMQANIFLGQADTVALVRTVGDRDIDLLTVSELTGPAAAGLAAAGIADELPYSFLRPTGGGGGTGIYSRYPLSAGTVLPGFVLHNLRAVMDIPGAAPTAVYALHPLPPYPEPAYRWMSELRQLRDVFGTEQLPMIVGADFNSTYDHRQYRRLLGGDAGLPIRDAAEFVGAGIVATYPADRRYPAVLAIDRILTRGGTPMSFSRTEIPGSDHHAVIGEIALRPGSPRGDH
jgi:endonuclease/exonuclease/phosphatase (EEP) superfamily protein YafD